MVQSKHYIFNKKIMIVFGIKIMVVEVKLVDVNTKYIGGILLKLIKNLKFNGKSTTSVVTTTKLAAKSAKTATQPTETDALPTVQQKTSPTSPKPLTETVNQPTHQNMAMATEYLVKKHVTTETPSTLTAAPTPEPSTLAGLAQKSLVETSASATPTTTPT